MTIAYLSVVVTIFIPLICTAYAKITSRGYDNRSPREFLAGLKGKAQRANYAQLNSYEVFAPYAIGVVVAHQMHAPQQTLDALAVSFVIARIMYVVFYIQDQHIMRSLAWFTGFFLTIALYFIGR